MTAAVRFSALCTLIGVSADLNAKGAGISPAFYQIIRLQIGVITLTLQGVPISICRRVRNHSPVCACERSKWLRPCAYHL